MVNITGLASLALLLTTAYVVDASKSLKDEAKEHQVAFKKDSTKGLKLFESPETFGHHTSELFTDLTDAHYTAMLGQLDGLGKPTEVYPLFTKDDMNNIQKTPGNCRHFKAGHLGNFKDATIKEMNWDCLRLALDELPVEKLRLINDTTFKHGMLKIVQRARTSFIKKDLTGGVFQALNKSQIKAIADSKDETVCKEISVGHLMATDITDSRSPKFRSLTPEAYSMFIGHKDIELSKEVLRLLNDDIFANVDGVIHANTMGNMTAKQLANFNKNIKDLTKCAHLDIQHLSPSNLGQLTPECYASYIENLPSAIRQLGSNFSKLPDNIFTSIKENDFYSFEKLDAEDWYGMRRAHLDYVVKNHHEACQFIPSGMADNKALANLRPNPRCFQYLNASVQAALLVKNLKDLPEDILSFVTSDNVSEWSHSSKGRSFELIEALKLDPKYLIHLGAGLESSNHPCILFESKDALREKKHLMKHMGPHCFAALTILSEFTEKEMAEFPERVYALSTPDVIQKHAPGFFAKVDSITMGLMVRGEKFCPHADSKILGAIPAAAFSAVTYKCMQDMRKSVSALSESQLSFLPEETVKSIDAEMAKSLCSVVSFKAPQLKVLNAAAFTTATKEVVAKLTVEQLAALSAEQLAAIPAASFASFTTKEQIAAIRPEALTKVVFEQIKEVSEAALLTLSPAQIRSLGKSVTEAGKKPTKVLIPIISKLPKEAAEAAKEVTNGASSLSVSAGALAVLGAVALLF